MDNKQHRETRVIPYRDTQLNTLQKLESDYELSDDFILPGDSLVLFDGVTLRPVTMVEEVLKGREVRVVDKQGFFHLCDLEGKRIQVKNNNITHVLKSKVFAPVYKKSQGYLVKS